MRHPSSLCAAFVCLFAFQNAYLKEDKLGEVVIDMEKVTVMRDITKEERALSPYAETMIGTTQGEYFVYERKKDIDFDVSARCFPIYRVEPRNKYGEQEQDR